jgi:hypothetical protein
MSAPLRNARRGLGTQCRPKLRRPLGDHVSPLIATLWTQINKPIGIQDDLRIVLNHQQGIPLVGRLIKQIQQIFDIAETQAGCRFVKQIQSLSLAA